GHSAAHVLSEVATTAASVTWFTRRPPVFRDAEFTLEEGRRAVAMVEERVRAGLPPQSAVAVTGQPSASGVRVARELVVLHREPMFPAADADRRRLGRGPRPARRRGDLVHRLPAGARPPGTAAALGARRRRQGGRHPSRRGPP